MSKVERSKAEFEAVMSLKANSSSDRQYVVAKGWMDRWQRHMERLKSNKREQYDEHEQHIKRCFFEDQQTIVEEHIKL